MNRSNSNFQHKQQNLNSQQQFLSSHQQNLSFHNSIYENPNNDGDVKFNDWGRRQYKTCKINGGEVNINSNSNNQFVDDKSYNTNNYMARQIAKELRKAAERIEKLGMNESKEQEQTVNESLRFKHGHESEYYQNFGSEAIRRYQKYYDNMK